MKIYIPDLGDLFSVEQMSWSATIKKDSKSTVALKLLKLYNQPGEATVTLPAGTTFTIDDIGDEFNTNDVTIIITSCERHEYVGLRFALSFQTIGAVNLDLVAKNQLRGGNYAASLRSSARAAVDPSYKEKKEKRKAAEDHIRAIREVIVSMVNNSVPGARMDHLDAVAQNAENYLYAGRARPLMYNKRYFNDLMYDKNMWNVLSTKKEPDGSVVRKVGFYSRSDSGGFIVRSLNGEILSVEPYLPTESSK